MEIIKTKIINDSTFSVVDVAGRNGGKWRIPRVIRVVETHGPFKGLNFGNVNKEYYSASYDARSKKQRNEALNAGNEVFETILNNKTQRKKQ